jgi:hypothetical protein
MTIFRSSGRRRLVMGVVDEAERVLTQHPGKGYCVECLGKAAGASTYKEQEQISRFFHQSARFTDRERVEDKCTVCDKKGRIIRKL